jgi:hypothetical protein
VLGYKAHIVGFAKSFMITKALFVTAAVFRANTEPSAMTEPQDQFANDQAYTSSITTKLYEEIPEKFHSLLDAKTYASFAKDVRNLVLLTVMLMTQDVLSFSLSMSTAKVAQD